VGIKFIHVDNPIAFIMTVSGVSTSGELVRTQNQLFSVRAMLEITVGAHDMAALYLLSHLAHDMDDIALTR
jgi:hypothetical protein